MARLRDPAQGCPWDLEQDFDSIAPYTIEEAYEVAEAIARRRHGRAPRRAGRPAASRWSTTRRWPRRPGPSASTTWCAAISEKMVRRHPHVFGDESRDKTADQQTATGKRIKAGERAARPRARSTASPPACPALTRAVKLQNRAARVGFDWPDAGAVLDKIAEETAELVEARDSGDEAAVVEEYGDLMFVMANLARHLEHRSRGGAAGSQRQVHPPLRGDRGGAGRAGPVPRGLRPRRDGRPLERRQARGAPARTRYDLRPNGSAPCGAALTN